jgi:MoaA/NifB/PqqE/SkfB family radical SAM enzyme
LDLGALAALNPPSRSLTEPKVPSVDWWITSRCNLACDFCYGPRPAKDPASLRNAILAAIEQSSTAAVTFCGGEPLLVRGIDEYARKLRNLGKRTVLNTNGMLLRKCLSQGLELAFAVVGLSIDGSTAAVHRAMRGRRADFDEVCSAAELIAQTPGVSLKLATVVSSVNQQDLPLLADLVRELRPEIWRLYQYSARGDRNTGQDRHALSEAEFRVLAEAAADRAAPVPTAPSSEDLTAGCLIIDPAGNVLEPTATGYARRGNCLDDPIDEIWSRVTSHSTIVENKRWHSVLAPPAVEAVLPQPEAAADLALKGVGQAS